MRHVGSSLSFALCCLLHESFLARCAGAACAFLFVSAIIPGFSLGSDYSDFICFERDCTDVLICEFLVVFFFVFWWCFCLLLGDL